MTTRYQFQELGLVVTANEVVGNALDRRLRYWKQGRPAAAEFTFDFFPSATSSQHELARPIGRARPVFTPRSGEVLYFEEADALYLDDGARLRTVCQVTEGQVHTSLLPPEDASAWRAAHLPFTLSLCELFKRRGYFSLHAAGLCRDGRGLLFAGTSGAGKTTLTLALLRAGFDFLSDDTLFLTPTSDGLSVLAFPDEIDCTDDTLQLFPDLRHRLSEPRLLGWHKRGIDVRSLRDVYPTPQCRPEVLVFPRVSGAPTSVVRPMEPGEAFVELVSNVILTEPHSSQAHLDALAQLVRESRCYRLETGRDLEALPEILGKLLREG